MKKSRKVLSILMLIVVLVLTLVGCTEKDLPEAKGYQWKVSKGDDVMYLIGTIHLTNPAYTYVTENIRLMLDESEGVAVEFDLLSEENTEKIEGYLYYPEGESIEDHLTAEEIEKLKSICNEVNMQYEVLKTVRPSIILSNLEMVFHFQNGNRGEGLDSQIIKASKSLGNEVIELETVEAQYEMLEILQDINVLKEILSAHEPDKYMANGGEELKASKELSEAYINGDASYIEEQTREIKEQDENYYNIMLRNRNIEMVNKAENIFEKEGTHVIAVGAAHYFGEDGIVKLLQDRGYKVEKL